MTLMQRFRQLDLLLTQLMARYGVTLLRVNLGVIFFWFGVLKFFPGLSPATALATRTMEILTFGLIPPNVSIIILAIWETFIGISFLYGIFLRAAIFLLLLQMVGTFAPLVLFPGETFQMIPHSPTLEGQYIIKNLVLMSAAIVVGATVKGGKMVANPRAARKLEGRYQLREQVS